MARVAKNEGNERLHQLALEAYLRELEADYQACEESLYRFFLSAWKVLEPATPLYTNWHLEYVCEWLEEVTAGKVRRLIINVPPRSLKSTIATICWPVWEWIKNPAKRKMFASYSQSLSTEHSMARRRLLESDWFQRRWGHIEGLGLVEDQNTKAYFKNEATGHQFATSTGGTATGMGGDDVVIDDPHNTKQAESDAERNATLQDIDKGLLTRFNNPKTGALVLIMQRLHENDATGHMIKKQIPGLVHLKLATEAATDERWVFPRSGRVVERKKGELLHPERLGPEEVAIAKIELGSYGYAGQHDQNPAPPEGGLLKVASWKRYKLSQRPALEEFDKIVQSWDMRFKKTTSERSKAKGDYVACVILGKKGSRVYLLDVVQGLWGFKDSKAAVLFMRDRWPKAVAKWIENKANGPGIQDDLEDTVPGMDLIEPAGDKWQRTELTAPYQEAGNLWVPEDGHMFTDTKIGGAKPVRVDEFVTQCALFPNGANDDMLDAFTQGVIKLYGGGLNYLRDMAGLGAGTRTAA
jgi:predicted phage terminase large subunit-like protein